jgi:hypothetical protein
VPIATSYEIKKHIMSNRLERFRAGSRFGAGSQSWRESVPSDLVPVETDARFFVKGLRVLCRRPAYVSRCCEFPSRAGTSPVPHLCAGRDRSARSDRHVGQAARTLTFDDRRVCALALQRLVLGSRKMPLAPAAEGQGMPDRARRHVVTTFRTEGDQDCVRPVAEFAVWVGWGGFVGLAGFKGWCFSGLGPWLCAG